MGIVATALALTAAAFYPWPEPVETSEQVNQKLFGDLDIQQIRAMAIVNFDRENQRFLSIQLKRVRDSWFIASAGDYPAGNVSRIAAVFNALSSSTIHEVKSSDESNHPLYHVVDSDAVSDVGSQTGIGTKISLADVNNRPVAQLIVGAQVGNNRNQRFVRVAGQPHVYVIDFDPALLSTQLGDWVDHNLLSLRTTQGGSGADVTRIQVDHYVLEGEKLTADSPQKYNYRAIIPLQAADAKPSLQKPAENGELGEPITDRGLQRTGLNNLAANIIQLNYTAVAKQPPAATAAQVAGLGDSSDLSALAIFGFRLSSSSPSKIDARNGQVTVSTSDGIDWVLSIGSVVVAGDIPQAQVSYYLLLTPLVNESSLPMPPEPEDKDNPDQVRDYERAVKRREDSLTALRERVRQLAERHASWLYLINEDALLALRPDESQLFQGP